MNQDKHGQKHYQSTAEDEHPEHEADDTESAIFRRIDLNQTLAEEMRESGIDCQAMEISSLPLEKNMYYSYKFPMSPKIVTNRGCIKVKKKSFGIIQIIQRN